MFDILQEILQSHPFLMSRKSKRRVANRTESNELNVFWRIREIVKQGLEHLFITSSTIVFDSHFFYKTVFEQHLFKLGLKTHTIALFL